MCLLFRLCIRVLFAKLSGRLSPKATAREDQPNKFQEARRMLHETVELLSNVRPISSVLLSAYLKTVD
jgi:hypothetical protein